MAFGAHVSLYLNDRSNAFIVNFYDERAANNASHLFAVDLPDAPCAVGFDRFLFGICEKRDVQVVSSDEAGQLVFGVREIPMTSTPAPSNWLFALLKSTASTVHPGVMAAG